ncbi:MAG: hypothetical protein AAGI68_11800 [Planctomycetota bacterium]
MHPLAASGEAVRLTGDAPDDAKSPVSSARSIDRHAESSQVD